MLGKNVWYLVPQFFFYEVGAYSSHVNQLKTGVYLNLLTPDVNYS